ncbi:thioredoxin [Tribonema minus]|uniref:Thioredoxin n=1 Tax=Tribonema minus TaxID=303371 RepID=A0A835ZDQ0_9STRA|nr:thioredoxin [Tribonema minus]
MIAADVGDKAVIVKVDVDENSETASNFDVYQMPTFIFLRSGEVVHQFSGARPDVLKAKVAELSEGAAAPDDAEEGL